jgi:hypothetical protein
MPINPNIALGVQPIQQPNMLGQVGQMMALKAAQQETEGYEGVKGAISGGMDPSDPRLLQYGPRGIAAFKAANEGRVKQQDFLTKSYANARETLNNVRTPEELLAFSVGQFNDPAIGPALKARGLTPESVAANLQKEIATSGFNTVLKKSAMGLDSFFKDETSRYSTNVAAQTAANRLGFDERKFKFEQDNPGFEYKTLNDGSIAAVNKRSNAVTILQNPGAAPTPPVNALTPTPAVNLNSLINPPVVNQPGAPTRANAAALAPTPLRAAPRPGYEYNAQGQQVPIKDPAAVVSTITDPQGTVRGLNYKGEIVSTTKGIGKPSPFVEKTAEAKAQLNRDLDTAIRQLTKAIEPGGMLEQSTGSGIGAMYDASMGFFGKATEGASAAAQLAPIADLVLKMVPRFEGPQSVKDVESYEKAAGDLANPKKPVKVRKDAAEVIIKLMTERKGQFEIKGQEGAGSFSPANTGDITTDPNILNLTTGGRSGGATVPQGAIDMLKSNPALRAEFDAKYGNGASSKYLGK